MTDLQVPVNYAIYVAVIYTFYNLLYAVTAEERESSSREGEKEEEEDVRKQGRGEGRHIHTHIHQATRLKDMEKGISWTGQHFGKQGGQKVLKSRIK